MITIGKNIIFVGALMVLPHFTFCQIDTTHLDTSKVFIHQDHMRQTSIDEVVVRLDIQQIRRLRYAAPVILEEAIRQLAADDVGDVISKVSSANVKSYGGLGGLKTVSMRSMGGQHTAIVVDGFNVNNAQSGQMNLGQLQTDGLISVIAYSGNVMHMYAPVSAHVSGSSIHINSFQSSYNTRQSAIRVNAKYGSFNRQDVYASGLLTKGKWSVSGFGKYRRADGDYDYRFLNGLTPTESKRVNNDYQDAYFGGQIKFKGEKGQRIRLGYKGATIDQGLPGAVILYNQTADERLTTLDHAVYGDAIWNYKKLDIRAYGNANQNNLSYDDPTYPNIAGKLNVDYLNKSIVGGVVLQRYQYRKLSYMGGVEETVSSLVSSDSALSNPIRFHTQAFAEVSKMFGFGTFRVLIAGQYVNERTNSESNELFKANPSFSFISKEFRNFRFRHQAWYKNSFRMPSFNELYYNYVGNSALLPETAHQFNYGIDFIPVESRKKDWVVRSNIFYNRVNNKIVAIPTKNLFVWSMQNVTDVNIFGAELSSEFSWKMKNMEYEISGTYSYQKAIDVTEESLNFGDQIAYTPEHMANLNLSIKRGSFGFRFSNNFISRRYALNENIESNLVAGYLISDVAVNYGIKLKKENTLRIQVNVKNVFNQSYAYVRSFVMPGRNFLISLSYAFN